MEELNQFKSAFAISPVPMLLVSSDGSIMLTNPVLDELFEYDPGELEGQSVETLLPDSIRNYHVELRETYFRKPTKRIMGQGRDLYGASKSGQIIPLELGLNTLIVDGRKCAVVVALDIRQRNQHDMLMNLVMEASASAMMMVNEAGEIQFVNKTALMLVGYDEIDLLNTSILCIVPEESQEIHQKHRKRFLQEKKARPMAQEKDLCVIRKDGVRVPVEIALTPVETPQGNMVVATIVDLTERIAAARAVAQKSRELEVLGDELMQFAYSASHDLKAPISTIVGLLKICIEDLEDGNLDEVAENLQKILRIGGRSAKKVEDVLEIARVGHHPLPVESVSLQSIASDIWQDLVEGKNDEAELVLDLQHEEPIYSEHGTLHVIIENLLSNAFRYRDQEKPDSYVKVESWTKGGNLVFKVTDNGIGIPEEGLDGVFKMFKRIDERSNNGLGMALVKKQIDRLNGNIELASTRGEGTEFTISLPLLSEDTV